MVTYTDGHMALGALYNANAMDVLCLVLILGDERQVTGADAGGVVALVRHVVSVGVPHGQVFQSDARGHDHHHVSVKEPAVDFNHAVGSGGRARSIEAGEAAVLSILGVSKHPALGLVKLVAVSNKPLACCLVGASHLALLVGRCSRRHDVLC